MRYSIKELLSISLCKREVRFCKSKKLNNGLKEIDAMALLEIN